MVGFIWGLCTGGYIWISLLLSLVPPVRSLEVAQEHGFELDVVNCTTYPLAQPVSTPDRREAGNVSLVPFPEAPGAGMEVQPPELRIKNARHVIQTQVDEPDLDRALNIARSRFGLAAAIFALSSAPQWGPAFTLHRIRPVEQEDGWTLPPVGTNFGVTPVGTVDDHGIQRIASLLSLLQNDPPAAQLLGLWYSAVEYERRAFALVDLEHILIRFVKVVERVAKAMAAELRQAIDPTSEARAIEAGLARLQAVLASTKSTTNRANIAVDTARTIEQIRLNTVGRQIHAAADALGLDQDVREATRRAWVARSTKAGHAPEEPSEVTYEELLDARQAAGMYLLEYFVWRSRRLLAKSSSDPKPATP